MQQDLTVCQASAQEQQVFTICERLNTLEDSVQLTGKEVTDVTELASKFERQTIADGKIIIPAKVVKNIQALCFGAHEWTCAGHQLDANEITPVTLSETKETMHLRDESQPKPPSIKPDIQPQQLD